ncbi:MAG: hypothetical protein NVSMB60_27470 [Mycobacterium sp.]
MNAVATLSVITAAGMGLANRAPESVGCCNAKQLHGCHFCGGSHTQMVSLATKLVVERADRTLDRARCRQSHFV